MKSHCYCFLLFFTIILCSGAKEENSSDVWKAVEHLQSQLETHAEKLSHVATYERRTDIVYQWYWQNRDAFIKMMEYFENEPSEDAETVEKINGKIKSETNKMAESLRTDISSNLSEEVQIKMEAMIQNLTLQSNQSETLKTSLELSVKQLQTEMDYIRKLFNQQIDEISNQLKAYNSIALQTSLLLKNISLELSQLRHFGDVFNQSLAEMDQRIGLTETRLFDAFDEFLRTHAMEKFWNDDDASLPHKYNSLNEIIRRFFVAFVHLDKSVNVMKDATPTIQISDDSFK